MQIKELGYRVSSNEHPNGILGYSGLSPEANGGSLCFFLESGDEGVNAQKPCQIAFRSLMETYYSFHTIAPPLDRFRLAIGKANQAIIQYFRIHNQDEYEGVSLACVLVEDNKAYYVSFGDISFGKYANRRWENYQSNSPMIALGKKHNIEFDYIQLPLKEEDLIYIVSKGLAPILFEQENLLKKHSLQEICEHLIELGTTENGSGEGILLFKMFSNTSKKIKYSPADTKKNPFLPPKLPTENTNKNKTSPSDIKEIQAVVGKPRKSTQIFHKTEKFINSQPFFIVALITLVAIMINIGIALIQRYKNVNYNDTDNIAINTDLPNIETVGGNSAAPNPISEPKILWNYAAGAEISSSPAISEGIVYFGCKDKNLYAMNRRSGEVLWRFKTRDGIGSSPIIVDKFVIIGSYDKYLYSIDKESGELIWKYQSKDRIISSPVYYNNNVFVGSNDGYIYALTLKDGKLKWKFNTGGIVWGTPIIYDGILLTSSRSGKFFGIDITTGLAIWKFDAKSEIFSSPKVSNNTVYFGTKSRYLYALNAQTGVLNWQYKTKAAIYSTPVIYNSNVFIGTNGGTVYSLNAMSGQLNWNHQLKGAIHSTPIVHHNNLIIGSYDKHLYALDTRTGVVNWKLLLKTPVYSSPRIIDDTLYIGSQVGKLFAISLP